MPCLARLICLRKPDHRTGTGYPRLPGRFFGHPTPVAPSL